MVELPGRHLINPEICRGAVYDTADAPSGWTDRAVGAPAKRAC